MQHQNQHAVIYAKTCQGTLRLRRTFIRCISTESAAACSWKEPSAQDIVSHSSDSSMRLNPDDIIIDVAKV